MIDWYKSVVFENYANFSGRARRSEYWYFTLMNILVAMAFVTLGVIMVTALGMDELGIGIFVVLYALYTLAIIIPSFAVTVRRLHDLGKSGWYFLIYFIPFIGSIWLLILLCTEGESQPNQYGPDPKNELDELNEIGATQAY
ncbi:DUF805 domain-containing protein [Flavobacterium sp. GT3R68]|uniref:DUF805 domain-containing protein n=1 Tax=Flavobacterium sp. GT3R68 TaxID=2594437 RepID=UPI000F86EA41|nr:DUF805 domain-containing protein [Flavobacterium sp. GT3R68]RTY90841.1 DUF805 domain-containing protein [Flavobacterium sp. GSN2]TRW93833.1 DUF805 domain-containing protein [Flavobacterium sp. GT3R68]